MPPLASLLRGLVASLVVVAAFVGAHAVVSNGPLQDPDRAYHLALSRQLAQEGLPRTLPQVAGLGWDARFPEKEFLFHALTGAGWALGGEPMAAAMGPLLGLAALLILLWFLHLRLGALPALLTVFLVGGMTHAFLLRLFLLRPHVLAVAAFCAMLCALLARRPVPTLLAAAVYALGYHALYIPLCALALAALWSFRADRALQRTAAAGVIGLTLGLLANPYFPLTVQMMWTHLVIAVSGSTASLAGGRELLPLTADVFLRQYAFHIAIIGVALTRLGLPREPRANVDLRLLLSLTALFLALSMQSPRAVEYAVPSATLLAGVLFTELRSTRALAALCALGLVQVVGLVTFLSRPPAPPWQLDAAARALAPIPPDASGSLVFNCNWARSPYIFYLRPDLRFIDVLDPTLLQQHNPRLHAQREQFKAGMLPAAHRVLREELGARYVLCEDQDAIDVMERDPGFVRLHPRDLAEGAPMSLYEVLPAPPAALLTHVQVSALPPVENLRLVTPAGVADGMVVPTGGYLDLRPGFPPAAEHLSQCALIRPSSSELERLKGASLLGVGGGRNVRVWFNGSPLFSSDRAFPQPRTINALIPLPRALEPSDRIEVLVCSGVTSPFFGVALSLWHREALQAFCANRPPNSVDFLDDGMTWPHRQTTAWTCVGPVAAPVLR